MTTVNEVPLTSTPQTLSVSLAGTVYQLRVTWNPLNQYWVLDLSSASGSPLLVGVPLITGADLLAQYAYLGIGGSLVVQSDTDVNAVPTFDNLGTIGHLYFVTA